MKSFLLKLLYLTLIVYAGGYVAFRFYFTDHFYRFFIFLPVIFFGVNWAFHGTLIAASHLDMKKFSQRFLGVFGIKIMAFLAFIITYSYFNPQKAVPFLITFFVLYVVYTTYEVVSIVQFQRKIRQ